MSERDLELIREALRFFVWGAGEGLSPAEGEPANEPETVLFEYACATGDEDYDGYADKLTATLRSEAEKLRHAVEFTARMCWRTDPPNASRKLTDAERLSAIKFHPAIKEAGEPHRQLAETEFRSLASGEGQ